MTIEFLPNSPDYQQACDIIDNEPLSFWLPALKKILVEHSLIPEDNTPQWLRINAGGNALFSLNDKYIVKIVPPNWIYQGEKEIASTTFLNNKINIPIPNIFASGELNHWLYIVMEKMPGIPLSDIWPQLTMDEKLPLIIEIGAIAKELQLKPNSEIPALSVDWQDYIEELINKCCARHKRNSLPTNLLDKVPSFINEYRHLFQCSPAFFAHLDLHPWNLLVEKNNNVWQVSGLIDFGDAMFIQDPLFDFITPAIFLAQGDKTLFQALLTSYNITNPHQKNLLSKILMAYTLIRPDSNINFVLSQVPSTVGKDNWEDTASHLFPST